MNVLGRLAGASIGEEMQRQRCKACWNADGFNFHVPDEVWESVVPVELRDHVVCLRCFDQLALLAGVEYAGRLGEIYFAGDQATLKLLAIVV